MDIIKCKGIFFLILKPIFLACFYFDSDEYSTNNP